MECVGYCDTIVSLLYIAGFSWMASRPGFDSGHLVHTNDMYLEWTHVSAVQRTASSVKGKYH